MSIRLRLTVIHLLFVTAGIENETVEHHFLYCPPFAAQRASLFASAERMCGRYWSESNDQMKLFYILNGFDNLSYLSNFNFRDI